MRKLLIILLSLVICIPGLAQEKQEPSSPEDMKNALTGGVPNGRWKEGLMFEGVRPMPWMKSAANWFPGTKRYNLKRFE